MGRTFTDSDFEPQARTFSDSDFKDAPNQPPPNPNFEVAGRSDTAQGVPTNLDLPNGYSDGPGISPIRAFLTNEPTQGVTESFMRGIPAQVGALMAATAAGGLTAGTASIPAAGLGAAGMEGVRQSLAQAYAGATGRPFTPPLQVAQNMAGQGVMGAIGQAGSLAMKNAGGYVVRAAEEKLAPTLKQYFGIAEPITKYVQGQGSAQVFTPQNLNEGAALANVGEATSDLATRRAALGTQIGEAETARLANVGDRSANVRHIREGLQDSLYGRGITDQKTAPLARGKEVGVLNKLIDVLTPSEGSATATAADGITQIPVAEKLTVRQAVNAKRLIDENLEFADRELSKPTEALLKRVNGQLRESVRGDLGPGVGKLWDDFGTIADAQSKLQEFTGTSARSNVEQRAVQSLRGIMLKNPGEVDSIVKVLGAGLPGGEQQARTIFNSIAAEPFIKGGVGAPSSTLLKGLTAGGLLSGPTARGMVRGSEAIANMDFNPAALSYGLTGGAVSPIAAEYMRGRMAH